LDYTTSVTEGQELLLGNSLPPVSRCITTANNRLLLGATTSTPSVSLTWTSGASAVSYLDFDSLGIKLTINALWERYRDWVKEQSDDSLKQLSRADFDKQIVEIIPFPMKGNGWKGIVFKPANPTNSDDEDAKPNSLDI
jgi:hypothetical protein